MTRRYSEEEAQRIFALVAERDRAATSAGLTLAELEEAARAAGLDPSLVAVAAAELEAAPHPPQTFAGAPVEVVVSRVLPGAVDDDAWARMVAEARRATDRPGIAGQVGRLREWTAIHQTGNQGAVTRLTAEPTGAGTRITLTRTVRDTVFGLMLGGGITVLMAVLFAALALGGADPDLWVVTAFMAAMGAVMTGGAQVGARVWKRHKAAEFEALADRLTLAAGDLPPVAEPAADPVAEPERAPEIDLDALPDAPAADPTADRRRVR